MRLVALSSGSEGNCIYVGTDNTHLLIDAGIALKNIKANINEIGIDLGDLNGLLVTHEHGDHGASVGSMSRKCGVPLYATAGTFTGLEKKGMGNVSKSELHTVKYWESFLIGDITVTPIRVFHDTLEPCAYVFESGGKKVAICTDLGTYDDKIVNALQKLDILYVEANHEVNMLLANPNYPYPLKQRILSNNGHLSNDTSGKLISSVLHDDIKSIMLAHLSKDNNVPDIAYNTVRNEIEFADNKYGGSDFPIYIANRYGLSRELTC